MCMSSPRFVARFAIVQVLCSLINQVLELRRHHGEDAMQHTFETSGQHGLHLAARSVTESKQHSLSSSNGLNHPQDDSHNDNDTHSMKVIQRMSETWPCGHE